MTDNRKIRVSVGPHAKQGAFIHYLHKHNVNMTDLRMQDGNMTFSVARQHLKHLKAGRRKYRLKITLRSLNDEAILQPYFVTYIGLLLFILLPVLGSQFVWKFHIKGATPELNYAAENYLKDELEIKTPLLKRDLQSDYTIRQKLMAQFPELSWVHFLKNGSDIGLKLQLAPINETKVEQTPSHLIARNSGIVTHYLLTSGVRKVDVNTTVYKGDTLVSGIIENGDNSVVVGAVGEVFADYWLETSFIIKRNVTYYSTTESAWKLSFNKKNEDSLQELALPKWLEDYIQISKIQKYAKKSKVLSEEDVESYIMPLLHTKILQSLPPKTTIKKENLLHVTFDNDTVKGQVLFLVNENIATPQPIYQGE
ncbi:sporulation protein YqfD [Lysinibacillus sp. 54212]|uniref:sporulation protein YqfD n=1 Tax=Lysinibacillus sp. 54212 TaxID=3119829 RepID=UPI002FCBA02E